MPRNLPRRATKKAPQTTTTATVSQITKDRIYQEALSSAALFGMEPTAIKTYLDERWTVYLSRMPWWFGGLAKDRPKKERTPAQLIALGKAREQARHTKHEREARLHDRINEEAAA